MKRAQLALRMTLGGAVCGGYLGVVLGAIIGAICGLSVGNLAWGLDGALLGGVILLAVGALYGLIVGLGTSPHEIPAYASPPIKPDITVRHTSSSTLSAEAQPVVR